jgi:hypothetical protein
MAEARAGLQVPKTAVQVTLALDGAPPRDVRIFVAEHAGDYARRQQVSDLLDDEEDAFMPVLDLADNQWNLVNKAIITWVGIPMIAGQMSLDESDTSVDEELFDVRRQVAIYLVGGSRLDGELLYSPRAGRARVADFLNDAGRFFRLWAADTVYLIHRRYVARLIEL